MPVEKYSAILPCSIRLCMASTEPNATQQPILSNIHIEFYIKATGLQRSSNGSLAATLFTTRSKSQRRMDGISINALDGKMEYRTTSSQVRSTLLLAQASLLLNMEKNALSGDQALVLDRENDDERTLAQCHKQDDWFKKKPTRTSMK